MRLQILETDSIIHSFYSFYSPSQVYLSSGQCFADCISLPIPAVVVALLLYSLVQKTNKGGRERDNDLRWSREQKNNKKSHTFFISLNFRITNRQQQHFWEVKLRSWEERRSEGALFHFLSILSFLSSFHFTRYDDFSHNNEGLQYLHHDVDDDDDNDDA